MIRQYTAELLTPVLPEIKEGKLFENRSGNKTQNFTDILKGTVNNAPERRRLLHSNVNASTNREIHEKNLMQRNQIKTFRELKNSGPDRTAGGSPKEKLQVKDAEKNDELKKTRSEENAAVGSIATMLGIKADELLNILKASNVEPSDLFNESKTKSVVDKLTDILNLNDQQKNILTEVLDTVGKLVGQKYQGTPGELEVTENAENNPWVKITNPNITVIQKQTGEMNFNALADKLKAKLDNLSLKQQLDPGSFVSEIKGTISAELLKNGISVDESKLNLSKDSNQAEIGQEESKASKESDNEKSDNSTMEASAANPEKIIFKGNVEGNDRSQYENQITANSVTAGQTDKNLYTNDVSKIRNEVHIPKNELINQVVEKAKVVLTGDKSEMVMDLKPDSLGKLALKIVTEHGLVVAKFVAESYQIKEVLETNMQLLKDSLEKQGMMVQGFSVSVRQESNGSFNGNRYPQGSLRNSVKRTASVSSALESVAATLENQQLSNPYRLNDNQINLTA